MEYLEKFSRLAVVLSFFCILGCTSSGHGDISERTLALPVLTNGKAVSVPTACNTLNLVSINLAHGRKDSMNQWLVSRQKTRKNLDDIAEFLLQVNADVVALQEGDSASAWSGGFDHVAYLAEKAGFPYYVYSEHARIIMGNYGTAVLSKWPVRDAVGLTFAATPPTASKGFTLAQIEWCDPMAPNKAVLLDVVSVHLDFSRKSVRKEQIDELVEVVRPRDNPLVIMGDFNSEWLARQYTVDSFADSSPLHVYGAAKEDLNTYKDQRLDWILLSRDISFKNYRAEEAVLSDHRAIFATIELSAEEESP